MSKKDKRILEVEYQSLFHKEARSVYKRFLFLFIISVVLNIAIFITLIIGPEKLKNHASTILGMNETEQLNETPEVIEKESIDVKFAGYLENRNPSEAVSSEVAIKSFSSILENNFPNSEVNSNYIVTGIDISAHQRKFNWNQITRDSTLKFAIIKSTEGDTIVDKEYYKNWSFAQSHKLITGAYHCFNSAIDPIKQAQLFISNVPLDNGDLLPIVVLDPTFDPLRSINDLKVFISVIENHYGSRVIIHTTALNYQKLFNKGLEDQSFWLTHLDESDLSNIVADSNSADIDVIWQFRPSSLSNHMSPGMNISTKSNISNLIYNKR